ncbi:oxidoreductase, short chain dehydrogenase reductase family protein [Levilactobacillus namurensis DSM 19117]|uniref:Oxidoreductase, short chain dehydrogenase reductase family protein n=1 Tax=Levilactobacillus namurensis DSM 19117 TaxID=1423773 RepID=A0A0R1JQI9_9LACO|nr:SDR family oxidoreductase [Levilactobacillus namurensis]KRK73565.1 oxidoreductase, short chain dehydrogenase reductase family protein [Levilactobacillus namurensis DSM 19117]GEO74982.1 short-chain dehydrogenase [Levilactobacillus namurensis]
MQITYDFSDKRVIITGGAGGIGLGMATAFVKSGASVLVVDVNAELIAQAKRELQALNAGQVVTLQTDISTKANDQLIIDTAVKAFGGIDVLINNAHASHQKPFTALTDDDLALSFNTGFYPTWHLMQLAYPQLKANQGSVINFASGAGINGQPTQAAYAAAKEAIRGLSRVAANEWAADNIRVNLISPIAETAGVKRWKQAAPDQYKAMVNQIPLHRLGDPEHDIGAVALFLASDASSYITGQTFMVDGGDIKLR